MTVAVVREARGEDAEALYGVLVRAFREYDGRLDPPSGVYTETQDSVAARIARGGALICEAGADAVGCAFCSPEDGYLYVGRFGVVPDFRRAGIGALLLDAAERRAVDLGFTRVRLNVRLILDNLRAYYEAHGYTPIAYLAHEGYPGPTYVQMEKVVGDEATEQ